MGMLRALMNCFFLPNISIGIFTYIVCFFNKILIDRKSYLCGQTVGFPSPNRIHFHSSNLSWHLPKRRTIKDWYQYVRMLCVGCQLSGLSGRLKIKPRNVNQRLYRVLKKILSTVIANLIKTALFNNAELMDSSPADSLTAGFQASL